MNPTRLRAEFELDPDGRPIFIDRAAAKHYRIKLWVEEAPQGTAAVTYKLHESYWDPIREVFSSANKFREEITSYGDFDVAASISGSANAGVNVRGQLSKLLDDSHSNPSTGGDRHAIEQALADIRRY